MTEPDFWANRLAAVCDDCGEALSRCTCADLLDAAHVSWFEADAFLTVYSSHLPPGDDQ